MEKAKTKRGKKFFLILLSSMEHLFSYETRQLREYSVTLEGLLQHEVDKLKRRTDSEAASMSQSEKEELYEFFYDQHLELSETYPSILRESLFISSYSIIESFSFKVCAYIKDLKEIELNVKDLRGDDLQQCYTYLTKVAQLTSLKNNKEYGQLQFLNSIRNALVHNQGTLKEPEGLKTQLKQWPAISLDEFGGVKLSREFNDQVLQCIGRFGEQLVQALRLSTP